MIKKGEKKTLIPAYRDMDPYDLPEEFSFLQAQDMSKLGFMQDLVAGIRKLIEGPKKTAGSTDQPKAETQQKKKNPMLARAFLFMEDGEFEKAGEYIDKVLDQEPQNPMAYLASVMTEKGIRKDKEGITLEDIFVIPEDELSKYGNYKKALRFADDDFRREFLERREKYIAEREAEWKRIESEYLSKISEATTFETAKALRNEISSPEFKKKWASHPDYQELFDKCQDKVSEFLKADYLSKIAEVTTVFSAKELCTDIKYSGFNEEWSDHPAYFEVLDKCDDRISELEKEATYNEACLCMEKKDYLQAADIFRKLGYFKDSVNKVQECEKLDNDRYNQQKYDRATSFIKGHKVDEALKILDGLGDWKDSRELAAQLRKKVKGQKQTFALILLAVIVLALAGYLIYSFVTWKSDENGHWHSVVGSQVGYGEHQYSLVQKIPPTCEEAGHNDFKCDVCGRTVTETISATGHDTDDGVITLEQTCTTDGIITYTCKTCGEQWTERIPAEGHVSDNGEVTKEPTCTIPGTRTYTCKVCGAEIKTESIPATGHTSDAGKVTKQPTCTTAGTKTYSCTKCGAIVKTESIPATGHTSDAGRITKSPTCVTTGTMTYSCIKCGAVVKTTTIPATGEHVYDERECVVCGKAKYKVGDIGPAGGYIFYDKGKTSDGWRYLEAAPSDINQSKWGDAGKFGTQTGIGTGKTNTAIIVSEASNSRNPNAATLCNDYTYGGYDDWFLPSKDELNLMYNNLWKKGLGGFALAGYWSSSEGSSLTNLAWLPYFSNGDQYNTNRDYEYRVRPVRAF